MKSNARERLPVRERILETATRLFYEQGYKATGINQIIAESEVAKASFYTHFRSKDELLLAYVKALLAEVQERMQDAVEAAPDTCRRFLAPLSVVRENICAGKYRGCPFQNIHPEVPTDAQAAKTALQDHQKWLLQLLERLVQEAGADSPEMIAKHARTYQLLLEGATVAATTVRDPWPLDHAEALLRETLSSLPEPALINAS